MTSTDEIERRRKRVEEIIERLEGGEVALETAAELRAEGRTHLEELRELLDVGEGETLEFDWE